MLCGAIWRLPRLLLPWLVLNALATLLLVGIMFMLATFLLKNFIYYHYYYGGFIGGLWHAVESILITGVVLAFLVVLIIGKYLL